MANDLDEAKRDFWSEVERLNPSFVGALRRLTPVVDELIAWSDNQPALRFEWNEVKKGRKTKEYVIKYCVGGGSSPFWAVWPRKDDGAKLTLLTDPGAFPDALREEAARELARIGGKDEGGGNPTISLMQLLEPKRRLEVLRLMERLLGQVQ